MTSNSPGQRRKTHPARGSSAATAATRSARAAAPRKTGWRRFVPGWKGTLASLVVLALVATLGFFAAYQATGIPDPNSQAQAQKTVVYFNDGKTELGSFAIANRTAIPIQQMPQHLRDALIATEDRTFYDNQGVSVTGTVRAFWNNLTGGSQQGGSTITQQYVKNYYLDSSKTYTRKFKEAFIALKIDNELSKDEILQNYLNTVFFGRGAYGIEAAAQTYFGVPAARLTLPQSAVLVAVLPSPSRYDPAKNPERAEERFNIVLDAMVREGKLDQATRDGITMPKVPMRRNQNAFAGTNGYLLQAVREELMAAGVEEDVIDGGGLRIISTFDAKMQKAAVDAMNDTDAFPTRNRPEGLHSALTAIDPASGAVRAMYGGSDYLKRQRNSATQDLAQAGSTWKPFTLMAALEDGVSLNSTFNGRNGQKFKGYNEAIDNYGGSNYGYVDLLRATASSINTAYVALNQEIGPEKTTQTAIKAGIPKETAGLNDYISNVLGTASPNNIDMANAYATFAARGTRHTAHVVQQATRVNPETRKTETVYTGPTAGERVFDEGAVDDLNYALRQVVNRGSGSYASRLGRQVAGKTGTSSSSMSAWFVGYTPQLVSAVSIFNTDAAGNPIEIPAFGGVGSITGGSYPTRIWTAFMREALDGAEELRFEPPTWGGSFRGTRAPAPPPTRTYTQAPSASPTATESASPTQAPTATQPAPAPTQPEPNPQPTSTGGGGGGGGDQPAPTAPGATQGGGAPGAGADPGGGASPPNEVPATLRN